MRQSMWMTGTLLAVLAAGGCATMGSGSDDTGPRAAAMLRASFSERGQAKLERLNQDAVQAACSTAADARPNAAELARLEKAEAASIRYPAGDRYLGDWREGEKIAQSGVGKQFSDNPANPVGGNCYACHQLTLTEISFGTIGPSLLGYGKQRGNTPAIQQYTYGKIYNSQAFTACSLMPRFGHNGILTEDQIRHLTALLLDPASPVNR